MKKLVITLLALMFAFSLTASPVYACHCDGCGGGTCPPPDNGDGTIQGCGGNCDGDSCPLPDDGHDNNGGNGGLH